jgi:hypothetical protein
MAARSASGATPLELTRAENNFVIRFAERATILAKDRARIAYALPALLNRSLTNSQFTTFWKALTYSGRRF